MDLSVRTGRERDMKNQALKWKGVLYDFVVRRPFFAAT